MNILNFMIAQAAPAQGFLSGPMGMTVMLVGMIAIFYFLIIMPQNKRKKQMDQMLNSMQKGDKVVTIGGIHGKVSSVKDNVIVLKVDDNIEISFEKSAIARILKDIPQMQKK